MYFESGNLGNNFNVHLDWIYKQLKNGFLFSLYKYQV